MKPLRFSIACIMAIIVIAAIYLAAIRCFDGRNTLIVVGSMPMASILVLGIPSLVRGATGRGKSHPFLIGFEGVGWTALLVFTGSAILFPNSVAAAFVSVAEFLMKMLRLELFDGPDPAWQMFGILFSVLILLLPQLVAALIGGWPNQRFKIKITIERRRVIGLETMRPSVSPRQVSMRGTNPDPTKA